MSNNKVFVNQVESKKCKENESDEEILNLIFPLIIRPMKAFGCWPTKLVPWRKWIFMLLTFMFLQGPMIVYAIKRRDNFIEASYGICESAGGIIYFGRLLWFGIAPELYLDVIGDLIVAWRKANSLGITEWIEFRTKLAKNTYKFSVNMIKCYFLVAFKFAVISTGINLFRVFILKKNEMIHFGYHVDYIVNVLDPFDPIGYSMILLPMVVVSHAFVLMYGWTGIFYALIIYNTSVLFRMSSFNINDLSQKWDGMSEIEILKELKEIVISYQAAVKTTGKLERTLKYQMLLQVLVNSYLICIVGFDIIAINSDVTTISNLASYGLGVLFELFLNSHACDALTREAANVSIAVWNANWYTQSPKVKRHLLFIMHYAQKPIGVSAGKFYLISLNSFLSVIRAGISYFTVIRQVYGK